MINKIDHINISVTDLEESKKFYINMLGFKVEKEGLLEGEWIDKVVGLKNVKAKYVQLRIPNSETSLELIQYFNPIEKKVSKLSKSNQIGLRHMAFEVQNIEVLYQKLIDVDVKMFSELQVYNERKKLCCFYGPDNVILELAEYS